jgi:hypothetical protein
MRIIAYHDDGARPKMALSRFQNALPAVCGVMPTDHNSSNTTRVSIFFWRRKKDRRAVNLFRAGPVYKSGYSQEHWCSIKSVCGPARLGFSGFMACRRRM